MSLSLNYPAVRPTLLLDFARARRLDPRITFTRGSVATYYDGSTTALAEQNLFIYSQEFDVGGNWDPASVTISANTTTAPDGTSTAELIYPTSTGTYRVIRQDARVGQAVSIFAKAQNKSWIALGFAATVGNYTWFDLTNGVVGSTSALVSSATITAVGNGWYRCSVVFLTSQTLVRFMIADSNGSNTATTVGTDGIFVWGAQLELRNAVTAYTATTASVVENYIPVLLTAAANTARFDHDPVTGTSLGLLIEEARTNLLTYSEDFTVSTGGWTNSNSSVTKNVAIAPNGTLTANRLIANTVSTSHSFSKVMSASITAGQRYVASIYVKKDGGERYVRIAFTAVVFASASVYFDLDTGTFSNLSGTNASASMTPVGNGWYRVSFSAEATSSGSGAAIFYSYATIGVAHSGNDFSGNLFWGAQAEFATFATSYIPTAGTTILRNADVAVMTGTNFSSWYNASAGTWLVNYAERAFSAAHQMAYTFVTGDSNNRINVAVNNANVLDVQVVADGVDTFDGNTPTLTAQPYQIAFAYAANNAGVSANGSAVTTDMAVTLPTGINQLVIGSTGGSQFLNSTINKIAYYDLRLANGQLQALTRS